MNFCFGTLAADLYPSKSGLMNKHIVKTYRGFKAMPVCRVKCFVGLVGIMPLGALYPSKSGLMNKHIVKAKVSKGFSRPSRGRVREAYA